MTQSEVECEKCENLPGDVKCSCGARFCEKCFTSKHLIRNSDHRRGGMSITDQAWSWISHKVSNKADKITISKAFEQDQATKWFGLHVERLKGEKDMHRVTRLVETYRFASLMQESVNYARSSPRRQFPSIISCIGETGAGKSTLIRSLMYNSDKWQQFNYLDAPPLGAQSGSSMCQSTTGEVNLYVDPDTFGSQLPHNIRSIGPYKAEKYLLEPKGGKPIDRKTAVATIYPRFLYIFSDVVCMVTRNQRAWADSATRLLEWSQVGAQNTVNQSALPALVIVLNAPSVEDDAWVSEDEEAVTKTFFDALDQEISENRILASLAKKNGDKTLRELLLRNFSTVHVHYIPLEGFGHLGNSFYIIQQTKRLARRIRADAKRVQTERVKTWTLFDSRQLSIVFDYAFKHLALGRDEAFDFNQYRQQVTLPDTVEGHFAEFLSLCMHEGVEANFKVTAQVIASCIVRYSLKSEGSELLHPSIVFNTKLQDICRRAVDHFLSHSMRCSYKDPQEGHIIKDQVIEMLKEINKKDANRNERRTCATELHLKLWMRIFNQQFGPSSTARLVNKASVCYACLFGRPEFVLPCGHVICLGCIREFDQSPDELKYPGIALHKKCVLCTSNHEAGWPYKATYQPDLSGVRLLSLDGGGVRGIIQLTILRRLEEELDLDMPFGSFFDLIVGTSAGGLAALGLGVHGFSASECVRRFKNLCGSAFKSKPLTKNPAFWWIARMFVDSIYETQPLENALKATFGDEPLFSSKRTTRVAVTTTTRDGHALLLSNYRWGDGKKYLDANIKTWAAARCTSAAPMYFESTMHDGLHCLDGGLSHNNPVGVAITEAKDIWGANVTFDTVLSIGCGQGTAPPANPKTVSLPAWLSDLFSTLLKTMNGHEAWAEFQKNAAPGVQHRSDRLNASFGMKSEPAMDDVDEIEDMEELAQNYDFHYQKPCSDISPVMADIGADALGVLAARHMAALYFFELQTIKQNKDVFVVVGWICCRLSPFGDSFKRLRERTKHFTVKSSQYQLPKYEEGKPLKLEVSLQQSDSASTIPMRIDANFGQDCNVTISGFPMTLQVSIPLIQFVP
ncbi:PNPLA-gamma [Cladobotryum mycophilum]|uniref:PNPLA-gamma n=1 Tax=Cladobotryum mycophilum TaxID=491253 RepID=A0ABR0SVD9_9HYPO